MPKRPAATPSNWPGSGRPRRSELGAAGVPLLAERTEKLRADWAQDHMVELGKARAQALGWPDAYAYSKALGEWA